MKCWTYYFILDDLKRSFLNDLKGLFATKIPLSSMILGEKGLTYLNSYRRLHSIFQLQTWCQILFSKSLFLMKVVAVWSPCPYLHPPAFCCIFSVQFSWGGVTMHLHGQPVSSQCQLLTKPLSHVLETNTSTIPTETWDRKEDRYPLQWRFNWISLKNTQKKKKPNLNLYLFFMEQYLSFSRDNADLLSAWFISASCRCQAEKRTLHLWQWQMRQRKTTNEHNQ